MSTDGQKKNARELLEIDVREVSLVDRPAIRREFLITKRRQEEIDMGAFATEDPKAAAPSDVGITKDENSGSDAGQSNTQPTETPAEPAAAPAADPAPAPAATEPVNKGGKPMDKGEGKDKAEDEDPKMGPDGKPLPPFMQGKGKTKEKTEKAEDVDVVGKLIEEIQKARSFTSPRIDQIKSAAMGLNQLLKTVDEGAFKAMLTDLKVLPSNATVPQAVKPQGVTKSEDGGEAPAGDDTQVAALEKRLADTEAKLADVLKARNPSASVEGEGGSDTQKPVEKSFWNGVL
jgi:hypothetical protein